MAKDTLEGGGGGTAGSRVSRLSSTGTLHVWPIVVKWLLLAVVVSTAISLTPTLVGDHRWGFLIAVWAVAAVLVATYATGRGLPFKYLVPGTLMLALFVVYPVLLTAKTSFTNYGDGTRGTKEQTITKIVQDSFAQPQDNAMLYNMSIGTTGSVTDGPFTLFLVSTKDGTILEGTADKTATEVQPSDVTLEGQGPDATVKAADGYTMLTLKQINDNQSLQDLVVPTSDGGGIKVNGVTSAVAGDFTMVYDKAKDTITDTRTGDVYTVQRQGDKDRFVDAQGKRASDQSWTSNVGLLNYKEVVTNPTITRNFLSIFVWTVLFATLSVATTFLLGLGLAIALNDSRMRGQRYYRMLLIVPYAIPGFISLLIWANFFNQDYGLINQFTGLNVNWFHNTWTARFSVVLTNLWMGFPYMFLVCTGALQAIPSDLKEAASIDGASGFAGFRKVTFPLLLVSVAPLLVATFAFNFNNYNAIKLLTDGAPFAPDDPTAGGTDILISYTMRLAFGAGGAQIGFASAISVLLFVVTGVIAAMQFRYTKALEDVN